VETLTGVQLCYGRLNWIEVSPSWKMKSLDCCTNTVWMCCKEGRLFGLDVDKRYPCGNVFSGWVDLAYDTYHFLVNLSSIRF